MLLGKNSELAGHFTYNHGKSFLILPIIKETMYTRPPMGVAPPPSEGVGEKSPGYLCFKDYNDGVPTFASSPVEVYTDNNFFLGWFNSIQFKWRKCTEAWFPLGILWRAYEEKVVEEQWWFDASLQNYCGVKLMKNAYVSTFLELWGAITLQVIQIRNYRIRFARNWRLGPLIRITRHFQYDPLQPNKKNKTDERSNLYWTRIIYF